MKVHRRNTSSLIDQLVLWIGVICCLSIISNGPASVYAEEHTTCYDRIDVVFVLDASGSISQETFADILQFSTFVIEGLNAVELHAGVILYGSYVFDTLNMSDVTSESARTALVESILDLTKDPNVVHTTDTAAGLNRAHVFFDTYTGNADSTQVTILISDGASNNRGETLTAAGKLRQNGVKLISLMPESVIQPELKYVANAFFTFDTLVLSELATTVANTICAFTFKCFDYVPPDNKIDVEMDIIFLIDESSSVDTNEYDTAKCFVQAVISHFNIDQTSSIYARVGVTNFGTDVLPAYKINLGDSSSTLKSVLEDLKKNGLNPGRNLQNALWDMRSDFTNGRVDVPHIGLVLTSGPSTDVVSQPFLNILESRMVYVGAGQSTTAWAAEGEGIAYVDEALFRVDEYTDLKSAQVITDVAYAIWGIANGTLSPSSGGLNDGVWSASFDVIFLINDNVRQSLQEYIFTRMFISGLISSFSISASEGRVGYLHFSASGVTSVLDLSGSVDSDTDEDTILSYLGSLMNVASTDGDILDGINAAFAMFTANPRPEARKVIVAMTSGAITLAQRNYIGERTLQRDIGLMVVGDYDGSWMEADHDFRMDFHSVVDLGFEPAAIAGLKELAERVDIGCSGDIDVIFAIDRSDAMDNILVYVLEFVWNVVHRIRVSAKDRVRFGIITYDEEASVVWALDDDDNNIIDAIYGIAIAASSNSIGRTDLALVEMKTVFDTKGRSGAEQIGIVITDADGDYTPGTGSDIAHLLAVQNSAIEIRSDGVYLIGVGIGTSSTNTLDQSSLLHRVLATDANIIEVFNPSYSDNSDDYILRAEKAMSTAIDVCALSNVAGYAPPDFGAKTATRFNVVFLMDETGVSGNKYAEFVISVLQGFEIGEFFGHAGVINFAHDRSITTIDLGDFNSMSDLYEAIWSMQLRFYTQGRNTADGLLGAFNQFSNDDATVPRILVLVTSGESDVDVTAAIQLLRIAGIQVIVIGVGGGTADTSGPLYSVATGDHTKAHVSSMAALSREQNVRNTHEIIRSLINEQQAGSGGPDLVFLIDNSDEMRAQHKLLFTKYLVQYIIVRREITPGATHVGMVTANDFGIEVNNIENPYYSRPGDYSRPLPLNILNDQDVYIYPYADNSTNEDYLRFYLTYLDYEDDKPYTPVGPGIDGMRTTFRQSNRWPAVKKIGVIILANSLAIPAAEILVGVAAARRARREGTKLLLVVFNPNAANQNLLEMIPSFGQRYFVPHPLQEAPMINTAIEDFLDPVAEPVDQWNSKIDLIVLVQEGPSQDVQAVRNFLKDIIVGFEVGPLNLLMGVIPFRENVPLNKISLGQHQTAASLTTAIDGLQLRTSSGQYHFGPALFAMLEEFRNNGRADAQPLTMLLTSVEPFDYALAFTELILASQRNIPLMAVGVGSAVSSNTLNMFSYSRELAFPGASSNWEELTFTSAMEGYIAAGGLGLIDWEGYSHLNVIQLPAQCRSPIQVVFLIDSSQSVSDQDFDLMKRFVASWVSGLQLGPSHATVAVLLYSTGVSSTSRIDFDDYDDDFYTFYEKLVFEMPRMENGFTDTHLGIQAVQDLFDNSPRPGVEKVGVVITDGRSTNPSATENAAIAARNSGIALVAVGVSGLIQDVPFETELQHIAGDQDYVFRLTIEDLAEKQNLLDPLYLTCEDVCDLKMDIVLLIDNSGSLSVTDLLFIKAFLMAFASTFSVGLDAVRFGVIPFSDTVIDEQYVLELDQATDIDQVTNKLLNIPRGSSLTTYTHVGIARARKMFQDKGRPLVPHTAIVVSDGRSTLAYETRRQAEAAHAEFIHLIAFGIGDVAGGFVYIDELEYIATDFQSIVLANSAASLQQPSIREETIKKLTHLSCAGSFTCEEPVIVSFITHFDSDEMEEKFFDLSREIQRGFPSANLLLEEADPAIPGSLEDAFDQQVYNLDTTVNFFNETRIIVIVTEHPPTDDVDLPTASSRLESIAYRAMNARILVAVIDAGSSSSRYTAVASSKQLLVQSDDFEKQPVRRSLMGQLCIIPCEGGEEISTVLLTCVKCPFGTYRNISEDPYCRSCPDGNTTNIRGADSIDQCEGECAVNHDVIFMMDMSYSVLPLEENLMKFFVWATASQWDIQEDETRAAIFGYSSGVHHDQTLPLYLSTSPLVVKTAITDSIQKIEGEYGTATGEALGESILHFLQHGRPRTRRILVLITDGQATDPSEVIVQARNARENWVHVIAVGIIRSSLDLPSQEYIRQELRNFATDAASVLTVSSYLELQTVDILELSCTDGFECPHEVDLVVLDDIEIVENQHATNVFIERELRSSFPSTRLNGDIPVVEVDSAIPSRTFALASAILAAANSFLLSNQQPRVLLIMTDQVIGDMSAIVTAAQVHKDGGTIVALINAGSQSRDSFLPVVSSTKFLFQTLKYFGEPPQLRIILGTCCITPCPYGSQISQVTGWCVECPMNYYRSSNERLCQECPDDKVTPAAGAASIDDCVDPCGSGNELSDTTGACIECGIGFYRDATNTSMKRCQACPPGQTTDRRGAEDITECIDICQSVADIVFVLDTSDSVDIAAVQIMKAFIWDIANRLPLGENTTRLGMVSYGETVQEDQVLELDHSVGDSLQQIKDELYEAISRLAKVPNTYGTQTGAALARMRQMMDLKGRDGVARRAIVITDGRSTDPGTLIQQAALLRSDWIYTIAIGITGQLSGSNLNDVLEELRHIATDLTSILEISSFFELPGLDVLGLSCTGGFSCLLDVDIAIINIMLQLENQAKALQFIDGVQDRFNGSSVEEFPVSQIADINVLITELAAAMTHLTTNPDKAKVLLVMTDTAWPDAVFDLVQSYKATLRMYGVLCMIINAGPSDSRLDTVVSSSRYLFETTEFVETDTSPPDSRVINRMILGSMCIGPCGDGQENSQNIGWCVPCESGTYRNASVDPGCQPCLPGKTTRRTGAVTENECVEFCTVDVDVIFLLDVSSNVDTTDVAAMRDFISNTIEGLELGPAASRVGMISFAEDVTQHLAIAASTTASTQAAVGTITKPSNDLLAVLPEAMQAMIDDFTANSRPGIPQIGVLISGGISSDTVQTRILAEIVRDAGIQMIPIAVTAGNAQFVDDELRYVGTDIGPITTVSAAQLAQVSIIEDICTDYYLCDKDIEIKVVDDILGAGNAGKVDVFLSKINESFTSNITSEDVFDSGNVYSDVLFAWNDLDSGNPDETRVLVLLTDQTWSVALIDAIKAITDEAKMKGIYVVVVDASSGSSTDFLQIASGEKSMFTTTDFHEAPFLQVILGTMCIASCGDGEEISQENGWCIDCPLGTYRTAADIEVCVECPPGRSTNDTGSISISDCIDDCEDGTELTPDGCVDCGLGFYRNRTLDRQCKSCPAGMTTEDVKSTSMVDCIDFCAVKADIVFLIDASGSVQALELSLMKFFIYSTLLSLNISQNDTRVGFIAFSDDLHADQIFNLNQSDDSFAVQDGLSNIALKDGITFGTVTGLAVEAMIKMFVEQPRPNGDVVRRLGVVITDGYATDSGFLREQALIAREYFIHMIAIGVVGDTTGDELDYILTELRSIATDFQSVITTQTFAGLNAIDLLGVSCRGGFQCQLPVDIAIINNIADPALKVQADNFIEDINTRFSTSNVQVFAVEDVSGLEAGLIHSLDHIGNSTSMANVILILTDQSWPSDVIDEFNSRTETLKDSGALCVLVNAGTDDFDDLNLSRKFTHQSAEFYMEPYKRVILASLCIEECDEDGQEISQETSWCEPCQRGYYRNATETTVPVCLPCPDDQTTVSVGSTSIHDCFRACPDGYELELSTLDCLPCAVGSFRNASLDQECQKCPDGTTTTDLATPDQSGCVEYCSIDPDLCFLMDTSSSLSGTDLNVMKGFVLDVAGGYDVKVGGAQVALINYDSQVYEVAAFGDAPEISDINTALTGIQRNLNSDEILLGAASASASAMFQQTSPDRPRIVVAVLAGPSADPELVRLQGLILRQSWVLTFAIGIQKPEMSQTDFNLMEEDLRNIATDYSSVRRYQSFLDLVQSDVKDTLCTEFQCEVNMDIVIIVDIDDSVIDGEAGVFIEDFKERYPASTVDVLTVSDSDSTLDTLASAIIVAHAVLNTSATTRSRAILVLIDSLVPVDAVIAADAAKDDGIIVAAINAGGVGMTANLRNLVSSERFVFDTPEFATQPQNRIILGGLCNVACGNGHQISQLTGWCEPCPIGYYRQLFEHYNCQPCPGGNTTRTTGSTFCVDPDEEPDVIPAWECHRYHEVYSNGNSVDRFCNLGFFFDNITKSCRVAYDVICANDRDPCLDEPAGKILLPDTCNGFVKCKNNRTFYEQCCPRPNMRYDLNVHGCVDDPTCDDTCPPWETVHPVSSFQCNNTKVSDNSFEDESGTVQTCPAGQIYSELSCSCIEADCPDGMVKCLNEAGLRTSCISQEDFDANGCTCVFGEFRCSDRRQCIDKSGRCDTTGTQNCIDGSDQLDCSCSSTIGTFLCHDDVQCVPTSQRCDRTSDCRDESDEANCNYCDPLFEFNGAFDGLSVVTQDISRLINSQIRSVLIIEFEFNRIRTNNESETLFSYRLGAGSAVAATVDNTETIEISLENNNEIHFRIQTFHYEKHLHLTYDFAGTNVPKAIVMTPASAVLVSGTFVDTQPSGDNTAFLYYDSPYMVARVNADQHAITRLRGDIIVDNETPILGIDLGNGPAGPYLGTLSNVRLYDCTPRKTSRFYG